MFCCAGDATGNGADDAKIAGSRKASLFRLLFCHLFCFVFVFDLISFEGHAAAEQGFYKYIVS